MKTAGPTLITEQMAREIKILLDLGVIGSAFLTMENLSEFLGGRPSVITLYRWAKEGKIPCRDHNGLIVAYIPEVLEWSASRSAAKAKAPRAGASISKFQEVRSRLRSLKTEVTALPSSTQEKGRVNGNC